MGSIKCWQTVQPRVQRTKSLSGAISILMGIAQMQPAVPVGTLVKADLIHSGVGAGTAPSEPTLSLGLVTVFGESD
jgi:hypothetical protein